MKALIIGGHRHGEWINTLDGSNAWVDIRTATTHRIRKLGWAVTKLKPDGTADVTGEHYKVNLAMHPDILLAGPQVEQEIVTRLLQMLAMNMFIREYGEPQETPKEPPIAVPDSPAGLFGPDGRAL